MEMKNRRFWKHLTDHKKQKYMTIIIISTAVLVLCAVIVTVVYARKTKVEDAFDSGEVMAGADQWRSEPETYELDLTGYRLKQDEIPELKSLVQAYCDAKIDGNPEALARVFGRQDVSEEELAAEKEKMELVSRMVDGYHNVSCYYLEGPEPDSYIVYPYFEIKYKDASVLVPSLTWGYARLTASGQFHMTQDVSSSVEEYISRVSQIEDVKRLMKEVQVKTDEAVASDDYLRWIYGKLETEKKESSVEIVTGVNED